MLFWGGLILLGVGLMIFVIRSKIATQDEETEKKDDPSGAKAKPRPRKRG